MDNYAVVGNPINHSKSPLIHSLFAQQTKQNISYGVIESPLTGFKQTVETFFAGSNNKGLNVTVPFKEQAWTLCQTRTQNAELSGAVNTLSLDPKGKIVGDNTDGMGLVSDLKNNGVVLKDKKILLVGAGGAVRGVLQPILEEHPFKICICNRTIDKATHLKSLFKGFGDIESGSFEDFSEPFDLVINGTSASLKGELPPLSPNVIVAGTICYDMMYGKEETVFNQWARDLGAAKVLDGLGMLVGQAAESFCIWRGVMPNTKNVIEKLRQN